MVEISLYCPSCADRVHFKALALDFDEVVSCPSCKHQAKGGDLLTGEGKTLLDFLALESLKASQKPAKG